MTFSELYRSGLGKLIGAGVEDASLDARLLLCDAFEIDTAAYLSRIREEVTDGAAAERYLELIEERASRRPLQYIEGYTEFMGLRIKIDESALIPRQDTELLCELVLAENEKKELSVLDLCTGSGAIALSLYRYGGYEKIVGTDISKEALELAEKNRRLLFPGSPYPVFSYSDIYSDMRDIMREHEIVLFDVIVSNPPYIRPEVIAELSPEVRDYEPYGALFGGIDGLEFYRRIIKDAPIHLKKGGGLYLEVGHDEGEAVSRMMTDRGLSSVQTVKDHSGCDRVVKGRYDNIR